MRRSRIGIYGRPSSAVRSRRLLHRGDLLLPPWQYRLRLMQGEGDPSSDGGIGRLVDTRPDELRLEEGERDVGRSVGEAAARHAELAHAAIKGERQCDPTVARQIGRGRRLWKDDEANSSR